MMTTNAGKFYIAQCPKCHVGLKEISPVPLYRCQGCKSFLLVKNWKLQDAVSPEDVSSENHTSKENSGNTGPIFDDGVVCSKAKVGSSDDAKDLAIPNGRNTVEVDGESEEKLEKSGSFSYKNKPENGCDPDHTVLNNTSTFSLSITPAPHFSHQREDEENGLVVSCDSDREEEECNGNEQEEPSMSYCVSVPSNQTNHCPREATVAIVRSEGEEAKYRVNGESSVVVGKSNIFLDHKGAPENGNDYRKPNSYNEAITQTPESSTNEKELYIDIEGNKEDVDHQKCVPWENVKKIASLKYTFEKLHEDTLFEEIMNSSSESSSQSNDSNATVTSPNMEEVGIDIKCWKYGENSLCPPDSDILDMKNGKNAVESWQTDKEGGAALLITSKDGLIKHLTTSFDGYKEGRTVYDLTDVVSPGVNGVNFSGNCNEDTFVSNTELGKSEVNFLSNDCKKEFRNFELLPSNQDLAPRNSDIVSQRDGVNQCYKIETERNSLTCEGSGNCLSNIPNKRRPKSMRTFRPRLTSDCSNITDKEEGKSFIRNGNEDSEFEATVYSASLSSGKSDFGNKNVTLVCEPELEQNLRSPSPSESCSLTESIISPNNESYSKTSIAGSHFEGVEVQFTSPSSSESLTKDCMLSPSNHESSAKNPNFSLCPEDVSENDVNVPSVLVPARKNEDVVSEVGNLEQQSASASLLVVCSSALYNKLSSSYRELPAENPNVISPLQDDVLHVSANPASRDSDFVNENVSSVLKTEDLEQQSVPKSLTESGSLSSPTSSEISAECLVPSDIEEEISNVSAYPASESLLQNENVMSNAVYLEQQLASPSLLAAYSLPADNAISPNDHESLAENDSVTGRPEEDVLDPYANLCSLRDSVVAVENMGVVPKATDLEQHLTSHSVMESYSSTSPSSNERTTESCMLSSDFENGFSNVHEPLPGNPSLTPHLEDETVLDVSSNLGNKNVSAAVSERHLNSEPLLESRSLTSSLRREVSTQSSILYSDIEDELSNVPSNIDSVDKSIFKNKNADIMSEADSERRFTSSSSGLSSLSSDSERPLFPSNQESPSANGTITSYPQLGPENDAELNTDGNLKLKPQVINHDSAASEQANKLPPRKKKVNPKHAELLRKLDELKFEIRNSIGERKKGSNPRVKSDHVETTGKSLLRDHGFKEDSKQSLSSSLEHPKGSLSTGWLAQKQTQISDRTNSPSNHNAEHYRESSPGSSSSSSSPSSKISSRTSPTAATKGSQPHTGKKPPHPYNSGNKMEAHEKRKLRNKEKVWSEKPRCMPFLGGAPFIVCYECREFLQMPRDLHISKPKFKLQCRCCFKFLKFSLVGQTLLVPWSQAEMQSSR